MRHIPAALKRRNVFIIFQREENQRRASKALFPPLSLWFPAMSAPSRSVGWTGLWAVSAGC